MMLLAQSFDPFQGQQQRKVPFFARCRILSRTRRVLLNLKNKMHNNSNSCRQFPPVMMPDHHFMLPAQHIIPPQSWFCCYGCCYDPYMSPMIIPPPFPVHPHQLPYSICVHFSSNKNSNVDSSSSAESTLYSSSSSMHSYNEKSLVEEVEHNGLEDHYYRDNYPVISRSNSDIMLERTRPNQRPPINRWNSTNNNIFYH